MTDEADLNFSAEVTKQVESSARGERFVRSVLTMGGAFLAALCGAFLTEPLWPPTLIEVLVVIGAVLSLVGGAFGLMVDKTPGETLDVARRAVGAGRDAQDALVQAYDTLESYEEVSRRLRSLYMAASQGREFIEQATSEMTDLPTAISRCLDACGSDLKVAMGFVMGEYWTICVYQTVQTDRGRELQCVAHDRSVKCDLKDARKWREGVGPGGIALAKNDEVVVPDVLDEAAGSAFRINSKLSKPDDLHRYRSMCAVPISVGSSDVPWGVVLATSSNPRHFGASNSYGVSPEEGVRTVAGLCALLVAVDSLVAKSAASRA